MPADELAIVTVGEPTPALNRFFYVEVGRAWNWTDRLGWSLREWDEHVRRDGLQTIVGYHRGAPVGFCELEAQDEGDVQIGYFGLLPQFIGRRFGGALLTAGVEAAWAVAGARRVWVHTCSRDHAAALPNYQARGFSIYREQRR